MLRPIAASLAVAAFGLFAFVGVAAAGKFNNKVDIGDKAPAFSELPGTDGKSYSLSDMKDAKAVVVIFTCNGCPIAVRYQDKIKQFAADYADKGVRVIAVNPNREGLEAMKRRSEEQEFNFPYVADDSQDVARSYGASTTPHFFLLDGDRSIAYMGAFDTRNEKEGLVAATDAVLAGKKPEVAETRQFGCGVKYKNR